MKHPVVFFYHTYMSSINFLYGDPWTKAVPNPRGRYLSFNMPQLQSPVALALRCIPVESENNTCDPGFVNASGSVKSDFRKYLSGLVLILRHTSMNGG